MRSKPDTVQGDDTIAAISTPPGVGAIAIVRMSGDQAIPIADNLFRGSSRLADAPSQTLHHGTIVDPQSGEQVDEVLVAVMRAPGTYTAEDIVEINCHGGLLLTGNILELVVRQGARLADPGEFTRRAFLNGRIDLLQAEAVADVIHSKAELSLKMARKQLSGGLSEEIGQIRQEVVACLSLVEAELDFSDQDLPIEAIQPARRHLQSAQKALARMLAGAQFGRQLREGFQVVLVGRTNVGKSSLFNALLGTDRAIVTDLPGTTRDTISEELSLRGIPVRLVDTAGLHARPGLIEREGVRRTREQIAAADLVVVVVDGSQRLQPEDGHILEETSGRRGLVVVNKIDLPDGMEWDGLGSLICSRGLLRVSAIRGDGVPELAEAVRMELFNDHGPEMAQPLVSKLRHQKDLQRSLEKIQVALQRLKESAHQELAAEDLRDALHALGEITGQSFTEEVLEGIFSQFCIGK